jgi:hypothetical protein
VFHPVEEFRRIRGAAIPDPERPMPMAVKVGLIVGLSALAAIVAPGLGERIDHLRDDGGRLALLVIGVPVMVLVALCGWLYRRWRDRPTVPFAFPRVIRGPGWRVWHVHGEEALVLVRKHCMLCLICRPAGEPLEQVLDALDPDEVIAADDEPDGPRLGVELTGEVAGVGFLRWIPGEDAYLFVLADTEHEADWINRVIGVGSFRAPTDAPQRWPALPTPEIAPARVQRGR